jgi:hypothetical protein
LTSNADAELQERLMVDPPQAPRQHAEAELTEALFYTCLGLNRTHMQMLYPRTVVEDLQRPSIS